MASLQCSAFLCAHELHFLEYLWQTSNINICTKQISSSQLLQGISLPEDERILSSGSEVILSESLIAVSQLFHLFPFQLFIWFLTCYFAHLSNKFFRNFNIRQVLRWTLNKGFLPLWKPSLSWWTLIQKMHIFLLSLTYLNILSVLTWFFNKISAFDILKENLLIFTPFASWFTISFLANFVHWYRAHQIFLF